MKGRSLAARQERLGWAFVTPTLVILVLVGFYPLVQTFYVSLTDARLAGTRAAQFVGLANYARLAADATFRSSVMTTIVFTVTSVSLEFLLGLVIALAVNSRFRGRGAMRAAMLIPWALPTVVSAKMWNYMLVDTYGVVNDLLVTRLRVLETKVAWLAQPGLALGCIVVVDVWKTTPFVALMLLAGLQLIPSTLYEAAAVDGATRMQQFRRITLPMLRPVILVTLIFRTLDALRVFDVVWVMTRGQSGTETMATYNFRQLMDFQKLGYGSAVSVAIFGLIALFVAAYLVVMRRWREADLS
jgi:trehalose/maltose transport system permease protein